MVFFSGFFESTYQSLALYNQCTDTALIQNASLTWYNGVGDADHNCNYVIKPELVVKLNVVSAQ